MNHKHKILLFAFFLCLAPCLSLQAGAPIDTSYTVAQTYTKLVKKYPFIQPVKPVVTEEKIIVTEELVYKTVSADRALHLDIYQPAKKGKYPALIMVHGGGWRSGNKSMERPLAQQLALYGVVSIPVEYRLSPEALYPAAIHDIKASIRFVKANAEKYNIDTTKVAISGESAGGHLAILVAMTNNVALFEGDKQGMKASSTIQAAIDVDGIVDFLAPNSLNMERKRESADVSWLGSFFYENPLLWKEASPIYWAGKNSVPVLFVCSSVPRFHAGRDELIDILNQNGIYSETHTLKDAPHSFWLFHPWFEPTKRLILKFLHKVFDHK
jgi:pectinesterase